MHNTALALGITLLLFPFSVKPARASTLQTVSFYRNYIPSFYKLYQKALFSSQNLILEKLPNETSAPSVTPTLTQASPLASLPPAPSTTPIPPSSTLPEIIIIPPASPVPTNIILSPTPPATLGEDSDFAKNYIMNDINVYRLSLGLSQVHTDVYTCDFAKLRAKEISSNFNHDGFRSRIDSNSLPYPSYSVVSENIAFTDNFRKVFNMWKNSTGHAVNMQKETSFVCVEYFGNYYAYEGRKP